MRLPKFKMFNKVTPFQGGKITVQFDKEDDKPAVIQIYEDIGSDPWSGQGFTAKDFSDALADIPRNKPIDLRINSAGGIVWDGLTIKTLLDEWPARKTASIDGMAASVASWMALGVDEIRAPRHAQMFVHDAWGFCIGNEKDMIENAKQLGKTSNQIADLYAKKTGLSSAECRQMMTDNTLLTAEEAHEKGFIDKLTDDEPISNFSDEQIRNMKSKLFVLNSLTAPRGTNNESDTMNREQKIALLNKWGVKFDAKATDAQLDALIEKGKPTKNVKYANGKDGKHADDCDCASCGASNEAPDPGPGGGDADNPEADNPGGKTNKEVEEEDELGGPAPMDKSTKTRLNRMETILNRMEKKALKNLVETRVKNFVEADKIPAGQLNEVVKQAMASEDPDKFLDIFDALPERPYGHEPVSIDMDEVPSNVGQLNKVIGNLLAPQQYFNRNQSRPMAKDRETISDNAKQISATLNRLKKYEFNGKPVGAGHSQGVLVGPIRDMWDSWAASPETPRYSRNGGVNSPMNANTMTADLLRQVVLSETMRAFRREFATLSHFAHTFQSVALQGNDYVDVPYYPLDTVASSEFTYANGYVITPNAQTLSKKVLVGGIGNGNATSGSGRKYKGLQFTAYEIRRQPWLNIAKLTVMAGEQLAVDVRGDIIGTQIQKANFGNAIWQGAAGGFDHTTVTQYLQNAAIKAFWPKNMRNCVLAPDWYTALAADPGITPFLSLGTTELLREGVIGGLYGFESIDYDALIPVANFIRGGDGNVTAGNDPNLAGYISYPSAVLIATAPIMPPPGVLKKLVAYEQVIDDQTGLAFTYQYFGLELNNYDNEIIECTYGSNLGEVAALKRLVSAGT